MSRPHYNPYALNFNKPKGYIGKYKPRKAFKKRRPTYTPGYTRTSGNYGRFNNSQELKYHSAIISGAIPTLGALATDAAGTTSTLCKIPQGDTEVQRDGRRCIIKSISMRGYIQNCDTTVQTANYRVILILDTQANGANPSYADVFKTTTTNTFNNLENSRRFRTLKSWKVSLSNQITGQGVYRNLKFYKKCNIPMEYSGTTGAIATIKSNNLIVFTISEGQNNEANLLLEFRLRFQG